MLTEDQVTEVATKLNEKVNIPFMSEETEQGILEKAVNAIDDKLDGIAEDLPEPFGELWENLADGISDEEAEQLVGALTEVINQKIDIPFLSEDQEANLIIRPALGLIVESVRARTRGSSGEDSQE